MASRKTPSGIETKEVLSAVVLADSFTQRFRPITVERPKVLLPLVNVPLITYTLEWLVTCGVEEIFVFCCAHAAKVQQYLEDSKWLSHRHCKVTLVVSTNCRSAGEALRLIDQKDIIKADFVLVSGDTVANMDLAAVLAQHKACRARDNNAIMTMVMRSAAGPVQRRKLGESELLVAVDPVSQQLLSYEDCGTGASSSKRLTLDTQLLSERDAVQIRTDLLDCQVYVCAPEVLMLFTDNFDYQNVRREFVTGVLSEEELGNKIYVHELHDGYATRVSNLRAYDAVSRDVLQRWTFPFTPDTNLLRAAPSIDGGDSSTYSLQRNTIYKERAVTVARSAVIGRDSCIGAHTEIQDNAQIECSVIGRSCEVGHDSIIRGSYIQDNVKIHDGVEITDSMICEGAVIKEGAIVESGCIVGFKVVIGEGHTLEAYKRVSLCQQQQTQANQSDDELEYAAENTSRGDFETDEEEEVLGTPSAQPSSLDTSAAEALAASRRISGDHPNFDSKLVGSDGAGYGWDVQDPAFRQFSITAPTSEGLPEDDDMSNSEGSTTTVTELEQLDSGLESESMFKREVSETFLRCKQQGFDQTNAVIELNSLKIAEDRTFAEVARYVLTTILGLCLPAIQRIRPEYAELFPLGTPETETKAGKAALLGAFSAQLQEWAPMLQRFLKDHDDQVEIVLTFEEFCAEEGEFAGEGGSAFAAIFPLVLKVLYDDDVLSEEALVAWADEKENATEEERSFLTMAAPFIQWLREAESEDEDDSEEEEEDDDDDESQSD